MGTMTSCLSEPSKPRVPRDMPNAREDSRHDGNDGEDVKEELFQFCSFVSRCEVAVFVDGEWFVTGRVTHRGWCRRTAAAMRHHPVG